MNNENTIIEILQDIYVALKNVTSPSGMAYIPADFKEPIKEKLEKLKKMKGKTK